jgi:hypothetical protein
MRVIVIAVDGLPVWALGAYGNDWIPTPNFDEFAAQSVVFDQHFADIARRITRESLALPKTIRWIDAPSLLPPWDVELAPDDEAEFELLLDPEPGLLPPDDDETPLRLQGTFALTVREFDAWLGHRLTESDIDDDSMIILTSGRGQHLGEHGLVGEALPWLHEEFVHLPLLIHLPGGVEGGRRVSHLTQTSDLRGEALLGLCRGGGPIRTYVVISSEAGEESALLTPHEKIIVGEGRTLYYVKPDDRCEVNDLWQPNIDQAEPLARTLSEYIAAAKRSESFIPPPLPQPETADGHGEAGGREHD